MHDSCKLSCHHTVFCATFAPNATYLCRATEKDFGMGPFPHDAPPATISAQNPMGTDGFAFVEFAHPEPAQLHALFRLMAFTAVAKHRTKAITVYRQGDVDYLVNEEPRTHAARFAALHGPCASSMGFR